MEIAGIQKLTLLDYPQKTACTVFLRGCNFRCPFCHNTGILSGTSSGDTGWTEAELFTFLSRRKHVLDGVCISGGEPLMTSDLGVLLFHIKELGYQVKLDTNGSYPKKLKEFMREGLIDCVAMDIKNAKSKYSETTGCPGIDIQDISESVDCLMAGGVDYEFRTTVVKEFHSERDFRELGQWLAGAKKYYLQTFEDSADVMQKGLHAYTAEEMKHFADILRKDVPSVCLRGYDK